MGQVQSSEQICNKQASYDFSRDIRLKVRGREKVAEKPVPARREKQEEGSKKREARRERIDSVAFHSLNRERTDIKCRNGSRCILFPAIQFPSQISLLHPLHHPSFSIPLHFLAHMLSVHLKEKERERDEGWKCSSREWKEKNDSLRHPLPALISPLASPFRSSLSSCAHFPPPNVSNHSKKRRRKEIETLEKKMEKVRNEKVRMKRGRKLGRSEIRNFVPSQI